MANNGPMPEYVFRITVPTAGGNNQPVELSPVDAYTFLTHDFSSVNYPNNNDAILQPKIQVLHNDNFLVVLTEIPPHNRNVTRNAMFYEDKISDDFTVQVPTVPLHVFRYIAEIDKQKGGNFVKQYLKEYTAKKAAGQDVYNPFSDRNNNKNWKSVSRNRKNMVLGKMRKLRSRKTRKNRR